MSIVVGPHLLTIHTCLFLSITHYLFEIFIPCSFEFLGKLFGLTLIVMVFILAIFVAETYGPSPILVPTFSHIVLDSIDDVINNILVKLVDSNLVWLLGCVAELTRLREAPITVR